MSTINDFPYNMKDILGLVGMRNDRNEIREKCPFCGKKNLCINTEEGNERFGCHSGDCNFSGRGATNFYAYLYGMDNKSSYREIMKRLNLSNDECHSRSETKERKSDSKVPVIMSELADAATRNNTYMYMLNDPAVKLSAKHERDLLERGFGKRNILELGYKTYPSTSNLQDYCPEYFEITKRLQVLGCTVKGVPGFSKTKNKGIWTLCKRKSGILVPYVNINNQIVGIQLRKDSDLLGEDENKYSWISSTNNIEGCTANGFLHYACDFIYGKEKQCFLPLFNKDPDNKKVLSVTEGAMKADLFHALTGMQTIAVPGVGILDDFEKDLENLKELGLQKIYNFYDMDYLTNDNVKSSEEKMKNIVLEHGMEYTRMMWKTHVEGYGDVLKGIDDYYAYVKKGIIPVMKNK